MIVHLRLTGEVCTARGDGPGFLSRVPVRTSGPIVMREPPKPKAVAGSPRKSAPVAKKQIGQHPNQPPAANRDDTLSPATGCLLLHDSFPVATQSSADASPGENGGCPF